MPIRDKKAATVGQAIWSEIFCRFGPPGTILSDEGREFVNEGLAYVAERWGVARRTTGGYQPQALPTERWHRWLNAQMTVLSSQFGQGWDAYLPAVVFCYNTSIHAVTGRTPYELLFGRLCSLLQDPDFVRDRLQRPADTEKWSETLATRMAEAYKHVREVQAKYAEKNRIRRSAKAIDVKFKIARPEDNVKGDLVLYWEPRQTKKLFNEDDAEGQQATDAPGKWRPRWTGPHEIIGVDEDTEGRHYTFLHGTKAIRMRSHVNKLIKFTPWSNKIASTSAWLDGNQGYRTGDWAQKGELIIVPLERPYPFGIACITEAPPNGQISYQWYGNIDNKVEGIIKPGWLDANGKIYYADKKKCSSHRPYEGQETTPMHQRDIVIHDFKLTQRGHLSTNVLRAIAEHPNVWWRPEKYRKEQEEGSISTSYRRSGCTKKRKSDSKDESAKKRSRAVSTKVVRQKRGKEDHGGSLRAHDQGQKRKPTDNNAVSLRRSKRVRGQGS